MGKNRGKPPNLEFFWSCPVGVLTGWDIFIILSLFVKALVRTKFYVLLVGPRSSISLQVLPVPPEDRGWQYGASPENRIAEKRIQIHHLCHMAKNRHSISFCWNNALSDIGSLPAQQCGLAWLRCCVQGGL